MCAPAQSVGAGSSEAAAASLWRSAGITMPAGSCSLHCVWRSAGLTKPHQHRLTDRYSRSLTRPSGSCNPHSVWRSAGLTKPHQYRLTDRYSKSLTRPSGSCSLHSVWRSAGLTRQMMSPPADSLSALPWSCRRQPHSSRAHQVHALRRHE